MALGLAGNAHRGARPRLTGLLLTLRVCFFVIISFHECQAAPSAQLTRGLPCLSTTTYRFLRLKALPGVTRTRLDFGGRQDGEPHADRNPSAAFASSTFLSSHQRCLHLSPSHSRDVGVLDPFSFRQCLDG